MMEELKEQFERGTKDSLKVQALTQRIAQLVAQYEDQLAEFRADATVKIENMTKQISSLTTENQQLHEEKDANEVPQSTPSITE